MIKYQQEGSTIYKCTNKRVDILEDVVNELNGRQILLVKMAAILQKVGKGENNIGIINEAQDLVKEMRNEI